MPGLLKYPDPLKCLQIPVKTFTIKAYLKAQFNHLHIAVKGKSMDYSESQCRRNCTMITTKDRCECIEAFMTDLDDDDDKVCTLADAENCTKPYASAMSVQARACKENCQVPCKATIYNPVYSFSTLAFVQVRWWLGARVHACVRCSQRSEEFFFLRCASASI